jgi:hypothetical protein
MKAILSILTAFLLVCNLNAQSRDTTFITVVKDTGTLEKQRFVDRYENVFQTHTPSKWLFKADLSGLRLPSFIGGYTTNNQLLPTTTINLSAEHKINPAFSILANAGVGFTLIDDYLNESDPYSSKTFSYSLALEPRWYFNMANDIKAGKSSNNFSGNYLGFTLGAERYWTNYRPIAELNQSRNRQYVGLRIGTQRRLFRYGFFDLSYGLGWQSVQSSFNNLYGGESTLKNGLFLNQKIAIGFGLATPSLKPENNAYCDALRCFQEESRMWKVDLYKLLIINDQDHFEGRPSIAFEQKINGSPFSIETSVALPWRYNYAPKINEKSYSLAGEMTVEPRWYYSMNKRIASGKSGNNLNGFFLGGLIRGRYEYNSGLLWSTAYPAYINKVRFSNQFLDFAGEWGVQYHLFRNAFVQYKAGFGYELAWPKNSYQNNGNHFILLSELKIGWAF